MIHTKIPGSGGWETNFSLLMVLEAVALTTASTYRRGFLVVVLVVLKIVMIVP